MGNDGQYWNWNGKWIKSNQIPGPYLFWPNCLLCSTPFYIFSDSNCNVSFPIVWLLWWRCLSTAQPGPSWIHFSYFLFSFQSYLFSLLQKKKIQNCSQTWAFVWWYFKPTLVCPGPSFVYIFSIIIIYNNNRERDLN